MNRFLLSLSLALALIGCGANVTPKVDASRPAFLNAVKPIQYINPETGIWRNGCTASSINRTEHLWLTAAHCVAGEMRIAGSPALLVEGYADADVAVLIVPDYTAPGELYRRQTRINFGTDIMIAGHPLGYEDIFLTHGKVANPLALLGEEESRYKINTVLPWLSDKAGLKFNGFMILDCAGAPGNSGSPVMDKDGYVVSVVQVGWVRGNFSPVMGGASYEALKWFDRYFAVRGGKAYQAGMELTGGF